jgi:adenylate cyclase class IV
VKREKTNKIQQSDVYYQLLSQHEGEETNKMQQSDVYYQLLSQHEERENQQYATIRCLLSTSVST